MIGISAFAITQMFASIVKPPSLKAVFPYDTPSDLYRDGSYDGGVLSLFLANLQGRWAVNGFNPGELLALKGLAREVREKFLSDEPDFLKAYTLNDYMMYTSLYDLMVHPQKSPVTFGFVMNPFDGEMYRKGSFCSYYEEIELPIIPFTDTEQWLDEERAGYLPGIFDGTAAKRTSPNIL